MGSRRGCEAGRKPKGRQLVEHRTYHNEVLIGEQHLGEVGELVGYRFLGYGGARGPQPDRRRADSLVAAEQPGVHLRKKVAQRFGADAVGEQLHQRDPNLAVLVGVTAAGLEQRQNPVEYLGGVVLGEAPDGAGERSGAAVADDPLVHRLQGRELGGFARWGVDGQRAGCWCGTERE